MTTLPPSLKLGLESRRDDFDEPSQFLPENMLREARRQRSLPLASVPAICLLDPDGDILRFLQQQHGATISPGWACYHTNLWEATFQGIRVGVVGCAVGASFAVLVAEELFASGCGLLVSVTSAGMIAEGLPASCMVLIDEAIRGEGTSHAYLPPAPTAQTDCALNDAVFVELEKTDFPTLRGLVWTTDAPFRETTTALNAAQQAGALAVEMEAAALIAFGQAKEHAVVTLAHITNSMAVQEGDFEKGPVDGAEQAMAAVMAAVRGWQSHTGQH